MKGLFEVAPGWQIWMGLQRVGDHTEKVTYVCRQYQPPSVCSDELTRNHITLTGFQAGILRSVLAVGPLQAKLGGGFSFNQVGVASSMGLKSGWDGDIYLPSGGQVGVLGLARIEVNAAPSIGLGISVGLAEHWVNFDTCSKLRYDPFCREATFREYRVGLAYRPPR